jgi:hypothetical protein
MDKRNPAVALLTCCGCGPQHDDRWNFDARLNQAMNTLCGEIEAAGAAAASGVRDGSTRAPGEVAFACRGARVLIVDAAGAGLATRRGEFLPSDGSTADAAPPDVRYVVEPRAPGWDGNAAGYRVVRDGTVRYLGGGIERLVGWLRADIEAAVSWRRHDPLIVRAAALVWRQRTILIVGRAGSGTSHLAAALERLGAVCRTDARVAIDDNGRLQPHPLAAGAPELDVALIVSTTHQPRSAWRPRRLRGARAVLPILDSALPDVDEPRRALRLCARLAPAVVTLQGPRPDAALVAAPILAALDDLLDGVAESPGSLARTQSALARVCGA